jgi:hypothetical protein
MTTTYSSATDEIRQRTTELDRLLDDRAGAQPTEEQLRLLRDLEDHILDLARLLPEGTEDYLARKLFELVIPLRRRLEELAGQPDQELRLQHLLAQMRDVVDLLARRQEHVELDDANAAAAAALGWLEGVPAKEIGRILGVTEKTVGAWRGANVPRVTRNSARVVLVAQLLSYIRGSWTPRGRGAWFLAEHPALDGARPIDLLDRDVASAREPLRRLARATRGQLGD